MAITTTTLSAAISASKLSNIPVASAANLVVGQAVLIDGEFMYIAGVNLPLNLFTARMRGAEGSSATSHDIYAPVVTGLNSDWPPVQPGANSFLPASGDILQEIGSDQTITPTAKNTTYNINKPSLCAITLANVSPASIGVELTFISNTAFAHTVTYAPGFLGGVNTVATFRASVGATLVLQVGVGGLVSVIGVSTIGGTASVTFSG